MALTPEPLPYTVPLLEGGDALMAKPWYQWLFGRGEQQARMPEALGSASTPAAGSAPIAPTTLLVTPTAGRYRVTWYLRITTPAATSSSATVTIAWTESAIALTGSGPAVTGNTIGTVQSQTLLILVDGATPITYAVAYLSTPASQMRYRLEIVVEQVP